MIAFIRRLLGIHTDEEVESAVKRQPNVKRAEKLLLRTDAITRKSLDSYGRVRGTQRGFRDANDVLRRRT